MLEGLAAWVLNTYVGEYVENLNTAQLSIAFLKGAVELENLPLKKDALKSLDIPIEVKSGLIGKITLNIPLRSLRSEPWVISIEKLYIVTGPLTNIQYDAESERKHHQEQKKIMLDALEEKWKVIQGHQKDQSASWFSYGASMAANILENIQLNVKDVHIRYEDDTLNPACPFACGIVIKYLSVQSTDSTWKPKFVSHYEGNETMFKLVDLQDFGIYCDTHVTLVGHLPLSELVEVFEKDMNRRTLESEYKDHNYILKPIKAEGKVTRNTSAFPLKSALTPRIFVELTLGEMSFSLATDQYQSLNLWQREFARHDRQRKFRKGRPSSPVSTSPRLWWQFAVQSHLEIIQDRNDRLTKTFMIERAQTIVTYSRIYTAYLKGEILTPQQKLQKGNIEEDLEFEELKLIREATFAKVKKNNQMALLLAKKNLPTEVLSPTQQKESGSLFQHWFPGWSGWSQPVEQPKSDMLENISADVQEELKTPNLDDVVTEDLIEQELQDVIKDSSENSSFLRKDVVFARMTFLLTKGSFQLRESHNSNKDGQTLTELQCSTISMAFESRPRTSAMKFSLAVGSLYVQDMTTKFSAFTYIISPQAKNLGQGPLSKESQGAEFFKLCYEKNPSAVFKYKVTMKTQPLDIIYSPELIYRIKDLFSSPVTGLSRTASSVSTWQFAKLRKQTQEELKNTLDLLMEERATKWNIQLEISAPKLIIPENVSDQNPQLVIIDLGNLHVNTVTSPRDFIDPQENRGKVREEEGEDKFETPLSTPPNETEEDVEVKMTMASMKSPRSSDNLEENCAENMFQDRLYEKYCIGLTEVQVLTGRLKDNWRLAYVRGTSMMHVVDRFNISVMLERRLITTSDIQWPTAKLSGNLPSLTFHLNEKKIQGLQKCLDKFSEPRPAGMSLSSASQSSVAAAMEPLGYSPLQEQFSFDDASPAPATSRDANEDNKLIVLQFLINNLSLEVHNQDRALVELRVTGVQADFHLKPLNKSLVLTVHSLLLVDAVQQYGPDFELLIASHKNVRLDSRSGSIKGSEFNSPTSPLSPSSPASPGSPTQNLTSTISFGSFQSFQDAISSAFHSVLSQAVPSAQSKKATEPEPSHPMASSDSKALIMLEYEVITTCASSQDPGSQDSVTRVLNLQFNSLDFIANQETLTEIMAFVNRTFPKSSSNDLGNKPTVTKNIYPVKQSKSKDVLLVNADFKRLNVMMVKFLSDSGLKIARKVATATLSCAKLEAKYDELWELNGSLGGLHLLDVTPEGTLYRQVVSIGQFQEVDASTGLPMSPCCTSFAISTVSSTSEMFRTAADDRVFAEPLLAELQDKKNACTFVIKTRQLKPPQQELDASLNDLSKSDQEITEAKFDMAALTYVHCPKFLDEMVDCVSEFKDYMTKVYTTIKTAATEVAMGIVGVRGDKDASLSDASTAGFTIRRDQSLGDITNTILLEDMSYYQGTSAIEANKSFILINARMESPILVFPPSSNSPQVLLAHLGEIVIDNSNVDKISSRSPSLNQDLINLSLTNMNLYSVCIEQQLSMVTVGLDSSKLSELTQKFGVPILYDTSVDLTIGKKEMDNPYINPNVSSRIEGMFGLAPECPPASSSNSESFEQDMFQVSSLLEVKAQISNHIKLNLSKEVYEQILKTVDNLTYDAESSKTQSTKHSKSAYTTLNLADVIEQDKMAYKLSDDLPGAKSKSMPNVINSSDSGQNDSFLAKHFDFKVPLFEVELRGDFGEGERGIVDLKLYDFAVQYEKNDKACTRINLHLKALQMDDLLEPPDSKHRQIIVSRPSKSKDILEKLHSQPKALMSKSCPDSTIVAPIPVMPPSLPSSFVDRTSCHQRHQQQHSHKGGVSSQRKKSPDSPGECPYTPPPSPVAREHKINQQRRADELVHIDVTLVDKKQPEFVEKYNKTNRFINIDFACLDATINLQTWVVLLDFIGMGAKVHDISVTEQPAKASTQQKENAKFEAAKENINSEINFQVESFTLIFNKPEYELAQTTAADLKTHIEIRDDNLSLNGQLGSLSLLDQSPHGQLYRQRFVSTGRQVVEFHFFKYGLPDPLMQRTFDMSLKLRMSSVRYIHTNRFQSELIAFAQNFLQLQDLLGRQRAASVGKKISEIATRGSRILLDIEAVSPILLIPHSSMTNCVLVADLGNLKLKNQFLVDGKSGTLRAKSEASLHSQGSDHYPSGNASAFQKGIVHRSMAGSTLNESLSPASRSVDPMTQSIYGSFDSDYRLEGLEMFSTAGRPGSKHVSESTFDLNQTDKGFTSEQGDNNEEDHRCLLDVISVILSDMDLFTAKRIWKSDYKHGDLSTDMEFSTFVVEREPGKLLKEKCLLELHIERNLEGDVSHTAPDFNVNGKLSSVYCHLDGSQYELVRGILNHNLGEKLEEFQRPLMSSLQNPSIQTILTGKPWKGINLVIDLRNVTVELLHSHPVSPDVPEKSLALLDFIHSQLSYCSFSNQLKEVDLVSDEIKVYDTRFKAEPVNARPNVFTSILQPSPGSTENKNFQMKMHLRSSPDSSHFTIILNSVRLMCVFDWLLAMKEYLSKEPPDPFSKVVQPIQSPVTPTEPIFVKSVKNQSPLTVSRGIATKRGPMVEEVKVSFGLVLNFFDTQFVVVEDSTSMDTNAVIFKNTAVITYKPQAQDKILSCSLQSLELFSCCLKDEEDTALSIIDPTSITIDLNANPLPQPDPNATGLLVLKDTQRRQMVLEMVLKTLNIRVSYHDIVMFLAIINSLPQQALQAQQASASSASSESTDKPSPAAATSEKVASFEDNITKSMMGGSPPPHNAINDNIDEEVLQLLELGYAEPDVRKALAKTSWNVDKAALWLTEKGSYLQGNKAESPVPSVGSGQFQVTSILLTADCISLQLIDDCGDVDIPLVELYCNELNVKQEVEPNIEGKSSFKLMGEYYNRKLSGWEPCLEPWKSLIEWKQYDKSAEKKLAIQIAAQDVLNLNITSTLLDLYKQTSDNWAEDYFSQHRDKSKVTRTASSSSHDALSRVPSQSQHKRLPFVPYVIRNDTGSVLRFQTATTTPSKSSKDHRTSRLLESANIITSNWETVQPGESKPFHFSRREKLRHQKSHAMHTNQLVVTVEGWMRLSPVSVDKVGIYFRHADPELQAPPNISPARVVFDVQQEGSARKLIIVRSALVVHNKLDSPIELKMESTDESGHYCSMTVPENTALPIPLYCINMRIRARPTDWSVHFCKKPLDWQHVKVAGDKPDGIRTCEAFGQKNGEYRFFVCVTRQKYPDEENLMIGSTSQPLSHGYIHPTLPGHILTLLPPLSICNRLPIELHYYFKGMDVSGNLKAGKTAALHGVDVSQAFELGIHLEYFSKCKEITIPPNTTTAKGHLRLYDSKDRLLKLVVRIKLVKGGSILLTISAQYWLINKSGLPLVFRQDGASTTAAGQFEEHEEARNVMPLLFSFVEKNELNLCQMRVGTSYHGKNSKPQWCHRFSLEGNTFKRALHVIREGNKPDWLVMCQYKMGKTLMTKSDQSSVLVYNIGVQITSGGPQYRGTTIVTFAPQFFLDNQSRFKLAIAQQFMTKNENSEQTYLTAVPKCSLSFHWPRVDLDQLLCVKLLDIKGCKWSGGFYIDKINSFHINMRDPNGQCHLLKVEVVQQGPTYFIVFADADVMPPPFRIDNFCDIPVLFYQTNTSDDRLKSFIKPYSSCPYAWDEPTIRPLQLTLGIMGGTSANYSLDKLEEGEQLHYENFIYIVATATFDRGWPKETSELVLDCEHSPNVVFRKKENSKRSQLWRMTGSGMLEHEGSTAPRDPRNPKSNSEPGLVLDIADMAPRLDNPAPLVLKKPDARRKTTQTWRFTEDGHLMCLVANMCVQAIGGDKGLQDGALAIFGPLPDQKSFSPSPVIFNHTLISRQKLRPGSGCVSVRVSVDGPIRVIELVDIQQRAWLKDYTEASRLSILLVQKRPASLCHHICSGKQVIKRMTMEKELEEWEVYEEVKGRRETKPSSGRDSLNIELVITLKNGIGVSLVNSCSEELMYITLKNINLEVQSQPSSTTFDISVAHIQADNQMWGAQRPVVLYVTPLTRSDVPDNTPALHISAYKVPSGKWNAQIFKHLYISTKRMTLHIEEQLIYKLLQLAGVGKDDKSLNQLEGNETYRALSAATAIQSTRYYFGHIKVNFNRVTLSMLTASKLNPDLKAIKNLLGTRLIAFEQANIEMRSFEKFYLFETKNFLVNEIKNHFKEELIGQAAKILGSVDFLGNPLGLFNDITEGISGLVKDGNITGLVQNVTHGFSNSTAKVVSSLSDGISIVTFDEEHNQRREALRNVTSGSSSDHVKAGIKGLGHGLMGGVTSLISQTISGAHEGPMGLIKGMGKGVIGTVTKPVSGVLDLTSGFANALRDTSLRTSQRCPGRMRPPRCTLGPGGLLPLYSKSQSEALNTLFELNGNDYTEYLIAMETLTSGKSGEGILFVLISSRQVIFLNQKGHLKPEVILQISHADILQCSNIFADNKYYVELTRKTNTSSDVAATSLNKPRVRCDKDILAKKVAEEIKYAKNLYDERAQTLELEDSSDEGD
uniref:UBA domain-containing protein n=1 Tax=Biomphalaria glabrata TaxID=6526 RepID=A0A2C9LEM5_BIOGL